MGGRGGGGGRTVTTRTMPLQAPEPLHPCPTLNVWHGKLLVVVKLRDEHSELGPQPLLLDTTTLLLELNKRRRVSPRQAAPCTVGQFDADIVVPGQIVGRLQTAKFWVVLAVLETEKLGHHVTCPASVGEGVARTVGMGVGRPDVGLMVGCGEITLTHLSVDMIPVQPGKGWNPGLQMQRVRSAVTAELDGQR